MSGPTIDVLVERLKKAKRVAIFTHQRPDPDALGSQAAAGMILKAMGAEEIVMVHFAKAPAQYEFLLSDERQEEWGSEWAGSVGGAVDTILVVDTCTYQQMEPAAGFLKAEREKVVAIDHHLSRDEMGPLLYTDTKAAACVEILWEVATAAGVKMEGALARVLMAGLVSDTGWFRFDSVTARTHLMAAALTPWVDNSGLYSRLQQMETKPKVGLMQRALASVAWSCEDRFACMMLRQRDFQETGAVQSQTEYLVDLPMVVKTVEVVALLTETPEGKVRGSLRSKRGVDVNAIAKRFSGGGHAKAAGCRFEGTIEGAAGALSAAVGEALK
jgi:bifunctional oligoribonuclease and PAP phosphatase NrnA